MLNKLKKMLMKKSEKDLQVDALEENAKIEEELKSLEEEIKSRNTESAGEEKDCGKIFSAKTA